MKMTQITKKIIMKMEIAESASSVGRWATRKLSLLVVSFP